MKCSLAFLLLIGCTRLSPGRVESMTGDAAYRVVLIRGFQDWYSTGLDRLGLELRQHNIACSVFSDNQWRDVAKKLEAAPARSTIVLIGFSYGADDVVSVARELGRRHRTVSLLITIDPVTPANVPGNVTRCVNFYQSNGVWDLFPWLRGIALSSDCNGPRVENIDIRHRADLLEPNTSHATIAANAKVHAAIASIVKNVMP